MKTPPMPINELNRINALHALQMLDTLHEERFDRCTRLAAQFFQVPIALVTLIDTNRQWFKSCFGLNLEVRETSRNISFCGHAILQNTPLIIPDAALDERFFDNPFVTEAPFIRFYAGYPLSSSEGYKLGTLCLLDTKPRQFNSVELQIFEELALLAQNELCDLDRTLILREKIIAEQALIQSEERYRSMVEVLQEGVVVQDSTGAIIAFNRQARDFFDLDETNQNTGEIIKPGWKIFLEDGAPSPQNRMPSEQVLKTGQPVSNIVIGICKQGSDYIQWFLVNSQPLHHQNKFNPTQIVSSFTDISHLKEAENRYKALSDAAFEGIAIISGETIMEVNGAFCKMTGYEPAELIGENPQKIIMSKVSDGTKWTILDDKPENSEITIFTKDGRKLVLEIHVEKITYLNKNARVVVLRDITHRKELERVKSEIISIVSHELRTPLTSIKGSLGLVVNGVAGDVAPQAKTMIEIAFNNTERLARLINDILDIEKIEAGKMTFNMVPVELEPLIRHTMEQNIGYVKQYGVEIVFDEVETPELKIMADSDRLIQVLTNLISNATKFSPVGGVVRIKVETMPQIVRVSVVDRGPGIPEEFQGHIFQKFAQADSSDQRRKGGTGLGLSITKAIVEAHGGKVGFKTFRGDGTTFFFDLPRWNE